MQGIYISNEYIRSPLEKDIIKAIERLASIVAEQNKEIERLKLDMHNRDSFVSVRRP